ncbi:MAG: hypothetical protein LBV72_08140 [Tannerella sp.]|jgi:hypothetical protein|nr:hypothetical protein [Tannerella sp.]
MNIKLFLTFNHELPLGRLNTSYNRALFDPTQKIMDIADKHNIKITLFSDILCAYRYKEWDHENFYLPYKTQLQYAVKTGHDVQLQTYPHWLTTEYNNTYFHPSKDFALSDFKDDNQFGGIPGIIKLSIDELSNICIPINDKYKCIAYRAGGYNIYPDTELIFNSLYKNGIRYDSSLAKDYYFKSDISEIDFRKLPDLPNWIIDPSNYHLNLPDKSGILEIPIATIPKTIFEIPTRFKLKKYAYRAIENRGKMIHTDNQIDIYSKIKMLFSARMLSFDNHTLSLDYLLKIFNYTIKKYENQSNTIMLSVISHPKSMGNYSFELMDKFITSIQKTYSNVEFMTYSKLYDKRK